MGGWQGTKASKENRKLGRHVGRLAGRLCATATDIKEHQQCRAGTTVFQRLGHICRISLLTPYAGPPARGHRPLFNTAGLPSSPAPEQAHTGYVTNENTLCRVRRRGWRTLGRLGQDVPPAGPGGSSDPKLRHANHVVLGAHPPHQSACVAFSPSSAVALHPPLSSDCGFTKPPGHA